MDKILVYFAIKYEGDWELIYSAINRKEKVDAEEVEKLVSKCNSSYITLLDEKYPERLKSIYKPPFVLFYKGNINLLSKEYKSVGVVGSRAYSGYGKKVTKSIVKDLVKENIVIVSGLAKGIDTISHETCLENQGNTIAVLGNGIEVFYPNDNKLLQEEISVKGLLISEYPCWKGSQKENFPKRNRIIAGLSDAILVTEAKKKSGSMITVSRALEMGKDIFCVPCSIECNSGCNSLIKEGAKLVESAQDILIDMSK